MVELAKFKVLKNIFSSDEISYWQGLDLFTNTAVIIKDIGDGQLPVIQSDYLRKDYEIGRFFHHHSILKPISIEVVNGRKSLILEDFPAIILDELIGVPMPIEDFLYFAISLVEGVKEVHHKNYILKELRPRNILYNSKNKKVKITGFGFASNMPTEMASHQRVIKGSFPYLSPEQSGLNGHAVDSRSDLYSLGVIFYEMLAGRHPFGATDPVGWVHGHIARKPTLLSQLNSSIPEMVSVIINKLLEKNVDDRYQTAHGLLYDLNICLGSWVRKNEIPLFKLQSKDISDKFFIPQKIYGREKELATLVSSYESVATTRSSYFVSISGESGVGKSSLITEFENWASHNSGNFLYGKFDKNKKDIPFFTIVKAFQKIINNILSEDEYKIIDWATRVQISLGDSAQLVINIIPQLEFLIGKQPPVSSLASHDALTRFHITFLRFIKNFTLNSEPLVLVIDDLQWADSASLILLQELMESSEVSNVLIIGLYRNNEVENNSNLKKLIHFLETNIDRFKNIELNSLKIPEVNSLLSDMFHTSSADCANLAN